MPRITMEKANIRQNVQLYEDALRRHGQFTRWHTASKCYCLDSLGKTDPTCKKCLGRGSIYSSVTKVRKVERTMTLGTNIITTKSNIESINSLVDNRNQSVSYDSFTSNKIIYSSILPNGRMLHIDYNEDLTSTYTSVATYKGRGLIRVPITGEVSIQGDFKGEIISISSIVNTTRSENINVISFWENLILTDSFIETSDAITITCTIVKPVKFLIHGISQKERYEKSYVSQEADMQLTAPGYYYLGSGDIITLLKSKQRASVVGESNGSEFHRLPFFNISDILSIIDELGTITDAVLVRNNEIQWGSRVPTKFSITLLYRPTFTVLMDQPSMRNAENKEFPRKVMLKLWGMESRRNKRPSSIGTNFEDLAY